MDGIRKNLSHPLKKKVSAKKKSPRKLIS